MTFFMGEILISSKKVQNLKFPNKRNVLELKYFRIDSFEFTMDTHHLLSLDLRQKHMLKSSS